MQIIENQREHLARGKNRKRQIKIESQFSFSQKLENTDVQESLLRISSFIIKYTNINYIHLVTEKTLIDYIKHHKSKEFNEIPFQQVIKDIKCLFFYLRNYGHIDYQKKIDLSLENFHFWTKI